MYIVLFIFLVAAMWDLSLGRVPNCLFYAGIFITQLNCLLNGSVAEALKNLSIGLLLAFFLFPLFAIGCLGAGDIKMIILLPVMGDIRKCLFIILVAFVIGAIIGLIKICITKEVIFRLGNLARYIQNTINMQQINTYENKQGATEGGLANNQIHFMVPLLLSVLVTYGGMDW